MSRKRRRVDAACRRCLHSLRQAWGQRYFCVSEWRVVRSSERMLDQAGGHLQHQHGDRCTQQHADEPGGAVNGFHLNTLAGYGVG